MGTYHFIAFVCGNEKEQEEQKTEITEHCRKSRLPEPQKDDFFSDWNKLVQNVKDKDGLLITKLIVISKDTNEFMDRIYFLSECPIRILPVNKQDFKVMQCYQKEDGMLKKGFHPNRTKEIFQNVHQYYLSQGKHLTDEDMKPIFG